MKDKSSLFLFQIREINLWKISPKYQIFASYVYVGVTPKCIVKEVFFQLSLIYFWHSFQCSYAPLVHASVSTYTEKNCIRIIITNNVKMSSQMSNQKHLRLAGRTYVFKLRKATVRKPSRNISISNINNLNSHCI